MPFFMNLGSVSVLGMSVGSIANVSFAVGPKAMGGNNIPADVQLVQFLLDFVLTDATHIIRIRDRNGQVMRRLSQDGSFTAKTFDAIRGFQQEIKRIAAIEGLKGAIVADGVVNSSNAAGVGTLSGTVYTIVWLNVVRESILGMPLTSDQISIEPLRSSLTVPNPNPLPPPPIPRR